MVSSIIDQVRHELESIRPMLKLHEGDLELVDVKDGIVYVRLVGACIGCPASFFTLKMGVEEALCQKLPEIKEVVAVE